MNNLLNDKDEARFKPSVAYLKVFSCRAYVTIIPKDRVKSEKMALRAQIRKMVGYEGNSLYLILLPPRLVSR